MSYPNIEGKHEYPSIITPKAFIEYQKLQGKIPPDFHAPKDVIFAFQRSLTNHILKTEDTISLPYLHRDLFVLNQFDQQIGISTGFGIGAPAATVAMEQLIATGAERFLIIGTAGAINPDLNIGDLVLCAGAIRDEGVSHHYVEQSPLALPSRELSSKLKTSMEELKLKSREGLTWTIDTPFRETIEEVVTYKKQGVLTVEMETAALFAVATKRRVQVAAAFTVSDSLADLVWNPQFEAGKTQEGLVNLFESALKTFTS